MKNFTLAIRERPGLIFLLLCLTLINLLTLNFPFFWDNILLSSKVATYFYNTNFSSIIIDPKLDVGHPPLFPMYLAFMWKIFGKTLLVSHLSMLPILLGVGYQLYQLSGKFLKGNYLYICLLLFLAEPTFLAQSTMVGVEMVKFFFFLLGINAIINKNRLLLFLSLVFLPLLSIRGIFLSFTLVIIDVLVSYYTIKWQAVNIRRVLYYALAAILGGMWYLFHYYKTSWLMFVPTEQRNASISIIIWNFFVISYNLLLYGKFLLWLFIGVVIIYLKKNKLLFVNLKKHQLLVIVFLTTILVSSLIMLFVKNPMGPRYFIYMNALLVIVFVLMLQEIHLAFLKKLAIVGVVLLGLISGHFWVFKNISNGWDGTLAHVPYFKAHTEMIDYINTSLPADTIGTSYPMLASPKHIYLSDSDFKFKKYNLEKDKHVLYSNISNDFQPEEIEILENWKLVHEVKNKWIFLRLYERP